MPLIPLPTRTNPLPDLPAPVLDRERRPQIDNRGVIAAVGALGAAAKMPLVDGDALAAPYAALGAVGEAIARTGSVMAALAEKRTEAEDYNAVARADGDMQVVRTNFEAWKETHPDPLTWNAKWQEMAAPALAGLLENDKLRPEVREKIRRRGDLWQRTNAAAINTEGARKTFDDARRNVESYLRVAVETQNRQMFDEQMTIGGRAGWLYEAREAEWELRFKEIGEVKKKEAKQIILQRASLLLDTGDLDGALHQYDALSEQGLAEPEAIEALQTAGRRRSEMLDWERKIDADPLKTQGRLAGLLDEKGKVSGDTRLTPEQIVRLQNGSATAINAQRRDLFSQAVVQIETGHMISDEEAKQFGQGYFRPIDIERLAQARRNIEGPTAEERVLLATDIASYDPTKDPEHERITDINARIRLMPSGFRQQFRDQLNDAMRPDGAVAKSITKQLKLRVEMGAFGNVEKGKDGPIDGESYLAAHERAADLQYRFNTWFKENPKATMGEAQQWLIDNTQADARAEAVRAKSWLRRMWDGLPGSRGVEDGRLAKEIVQTRGRRDAIIARHGGVEETLVDFVKGHEGYKAKAYADYRQTSVGYGTRAKSENETLTPAGADLRLREELRGHARAIDAAAQKRGWALTKNQREALISFDFNTGAGAQVLGSSSTLAEVRQRMALYTKVTEGGQKVFSAGLDRRRKAEIALFSK